MKVLIVVNGSKKIGKIARETIDLINSKDHIQSDLRITSYEKEATEIVEKEAAKFDVIIAVGGDGTSNEVVNGIGQGQHVGILFGIIPNGTGNDFLKMSSGFVPEHFVNRLENAVSTQIDYGYLKSQSNQYFFLNIADIGLGGKVVQIMNRQRNLNIGGKFSYATAILRGFLSYRKSEMTIIGDDFKHTGKVLMLAACNGAVFGDGLVVGPESRLDDGIIQLTILGNITVTDYLKNLKKIKRGEKIIHPEVFYYSSEKIEIIQEDGEMYAEADGELIKGKLDEIGLKKKGLNLINELKPNLMY
jgi:YegS/Rv2252/BmrU family lipid kinase